MYFTGFGRWLELVAHELTPADGVNVWRVVVHPLVELIVPTIKVDEQQAAHAPLHRGNTHKARLHQIHRLQFHVGGKAVAWVVLEYTSNLNSAVAGFELQAVNNSNGSVLSYSVEQPRWGHFRLGLF